MTEPISKRQRQHDMLLACTVPGITDSALQRMLVKLRQFPEILEQDNVRTARGQAYLNMFSEVASQVQLPMSDGTESSWHLGRLQLLLPLFVSKHAEFKELFHAQLLERPSTFERPWRLIVYNDEVVPGNVIKPDNLRKFVIFYCSFLEFDQALRSELAWLPIAVLRSQRLKDVDGRLATVCKVLMQQCFLGSEGLDTEGCTIPFAKPLLFFAKFHNLLCDESAIAASLGCKGHAGLRPCILCKNCVMKGSELDVADGTGYLVSICVSDIEQFDPATDADLWHLADMLLDAKDRVSKKEFDRLEKATGLNCVKHGLLFCEPLRKHVPVASTTTFDTMHNFFSHGIAALEVNLFVTWLGQEFKIGFREVHTFCCADWKMRSRGNVQSVAASVFRPTKEKMSQNTGFRGLASDVIAVLPLLRHLAVTVVIPKAGNVKEVQSFLALSDVVIYVQNLKMKRLGTIADSELDQLQQMQRRHLDCFIVAWGENAVLPKHHYSLHLPHAIRRDGILLDAFALERKHRNAKRIASSIDNSVHFERSLHSRVLNEQLQSEAQIFRDHLHAQNTHAFERSLLADSLAKSLSVRAVTVASAMTLNFDTFCVDDVVVTNRVALHVLACLQIQDDKRLAVLAHPYRFISETASGQQWEPSHTKSVFFASKAQYTRPAYWTFDARGMFTLF